jgi:hypothetical protein
VIVAGVVAGIYLYSKGAGDWYKVAQDKTPFVIFLVFAICAVLSAFIGLIAACCQNKCCRKIYAVIVVVVVLMEVAAIVIAFVFKDYLLDKVGDGWTDTTNKEAQEARVKLEQTFKCCGFDNATIVEDPPCGYNETVLEEIKSCEDAIEESIQDNLTKLGIAAIVVAVLEIILLISALYLACARVSKGGDDDIGGF